VDPLWHPAFGTWSYNDGRLTITKGLKYNVDILGITRDTFRIRIHSPGQPVVIRFAPAEPSPLSATGRARRRLQSSRRGDPWSHPPSGPLRGRRRELEVVIVAESTARSFLQCH
jgi:hypothetical protein